MSAFLDFVNEWLADYFLAATTVLAGALALRMLLRQPAARMAVAWSACLGLVALAGLTALPRWPRVGLAELAGHWNSRVTPNEVIKLEPTEPETSLPLEIAPFAVAAEPVDLAPVLFAAPDASTGRAMPEPTDWTQVAAAIWLVIAMGASLWILVGRIRTRHLMHTAARAPAWVVEALRTIAKWKRLPGLFTSRRINSAVALGALAPKIVLPEVSVKEANAAAVRAALAHEWAHIRHGDLWLLAVERLLLPLLAAHPLFWWLRRSIRLDQEQLADAAAAGDEPAEYAEALLVLARTAQPARHGLAALSMWEHPSTLSRRVAMILDPKSRVAKPLGRAWTTLAVALALPAILALSVVSFRPTTAQDKPAETETAIEPAVPLTRVVDEAPPVPRSAGQSVPVTQVHMELLVMSVNREKLAAADTTLEDAIAEATESRCRKEAGLVVSEIKPEQVVKLLDGLKKHDAVQVISRPSVITLDGREANVHIGGEAPILRVEETINGKHERRVEFKEFGTMLMVRPKLSEEKLDLVTLDIAAEQSNLVPPGEKAEQGAVQRDVPGLVSHKFKLNSDVKLGGSLLVAESPAEKKQLRDAVKQQFLLIVTPQRAVRTVAVVYADPRAGEQGEAARAATEAAIQAATAAEPEAGTGAATLLQAERDARAKETAALKRQIEALQTELAFRNTDSTRHRAEPGGDPEFSVLLFRIQGDTRALAARFDELFAKSALAGQKVAANFKGDQVEVYAPSESMAEVTKLIQSLGGEPIRRPMPMPPARTRSRANTPAESEAHNVAPTVLQAEQDARAKETADLRRQVALLQRQVERLQAETGTKIVSRTYKIRHRKAADVADDVKVLVAEPLANGDMQLTVDDSTNSIVIQLPDKHANDFGRTVEALDRTSPPATEAGQPPNEYAQAIWQALAAKRNRQAAGQHAQPPAAELAAPAHAQHHNWGVLTADVAEARLNLERAEKEFARVEQLKASNVISATQIDEKKYELELARIRLQRAEAKLYSPASQATARLASQQGDNSRQTEVKLLELDLADAKLAVDEAESELQRADQLRKQTPSAISEQEIRKYQFQAERAKIQMQRIMIRLEAAKQEPQPARR